MSSAQLPGFFGKKRGVDSAENYVRSPPSRLGANFVAAQCVGSVNTDTNGIPGLNHLGIHRAQGFVHEDGIAEFFWRGAGQDVLPARSDDCSPERDLARVNQMNLHAQCSLLLRIAPNSSRVTSGTRVNVRCVLGETLDLLAPTIRNQSARSAWRDRKAGDSGEVSKTPSRPKQLRPQTGTSQICHRLADH